METSLVKQVLKYPAFKYVQLSTEGINLILYIHVNFVKYIILSSFIQTATVRSQVLRKDRTRRYSFHALDALNVSCGTSVVTNETLVHKTKLRDFSPKANYTDRATAAYRRS
jgi:hypothetical protein